MIIDSIKYSADPKGKWILAGDLNSLSPLDKSVYENSTLVRDLAAKEVKYPNQKNLIDGKLDYRVQQNLLDNGFVDVLKIKDNKFVATAPTKIFYDQSSTPLRYDYIYVSPAMKKQVIDVKVLKDDFTDLFSDHYPVQMIIKNR